MLFLAEVVAIDKADGQAWSSPSRYAGPPWRCVRLCVGAVYAEGRQACGTGLFHREGQFLPSLSMAAIGGKDS